MNSNDEILKNLDQIFTDIALATRNMQRLAAEYSHSKKLDPGKIEAVTISLNKASYYLREKIKPIQDDEVIY